MSIYVSLKLIMQEKKDQCDNVNRDPDNNEIQGGTVYLGFNRGITLIQNIVAIGQSLVSSSHK